MNSFTLHPKILESDRGVIKTGMTTSLIKHKCQFMPAISFTVFCLHKNYTCKTKMSKTASARKSFKSIVSEKHSRINCYYSSELSANFAQHDVTGSFMVTTAL